MKWASKFQFPNKILIVDLNTGAAMVTIQTDLMAVEVMVAAVVDTVEISIGAAMVTIQTDPMAIEVMVAAVVEVMVAAVVEVMVAAVVDTVEISIGTAIMPNISGEYGFKMTAL
jgi:hypothetical protein